MQVIFIDIGARFLLPLHPLLLDPTLRPEVSMAAAKTVYFTRETIHAAAGALLQETSCRPGNGAARFQPAKAALLILDMQDYFLDSASHAFVPSVPPVLETIIGLKDYFLQRGRPAIFTRHLNRPRDAGMMRIWWRELITPENPRSRISADLDPEPGTVVLKTQYDAFMGTDLEQLLHASGTEQVVISGVMTHLCCESTARGAFMRGFEVFFPLDATADYTRDFHAASARNLAHGFAHICLADQLMGAKR